VLWLSVDLEVRHAYGWLQQEMIPFRGHPLPNVQHWVAGRCSKILRYAVWIAGEILRVMQKNKYK